MLWFNEPSRATPPKSDGWIWAVIFILTIFLFACPEAFSHR